MTQPSGNDALTGRAIAVVGAATAGAEVAGRLAEQGAWVAVFEQNARPYGKVEDGLPRWHIELRRKEYRIIDAKLAHPNVAFVPLTQIGRDLDFGELARDYGFDAVVLASGAWRDRPLPVEGARHKLLEKAIEKYRFRVEPLAAPDGLLVEGGRLVGLRFRRTRMEGGRPVPTDETFERRGRYVISSIGSIPEPIPGIDMKGELLAFTDWELGRLAAYPNVFSAGNVVTGKGNIVASRKHASHVSEKVIASFLGLGDGHRGEEALLDSTRAAARLAADAVGAHAAAGMPRDGGSSERLRARVRERQAAVGFSGDYRAWIAQVTPPDLE